MNKIMTKKGNKSLLSLIVELLNFITYRPVLYYFGEIHFPTR